MRIDKRKAKASKTPEETILMLAEKLKERYYSGSEMMRLAKAAGFNGTTKTLLSLFQSRGYMVTEEVISPKKYIINSRFYKPSDKTVYKIMTDEDYKKWDEEVHADAKRRLLAAVSY